MSETTPPPSPASFPTLPALHDPDDFAPVACIDGDFSAGLILICDHASSALPARYGTLGLEPAELQRHIAYDIGAAALTRRLAARLGVPAVLSCFSRLLIDPNRGEDDPTLIMRLSDGSVIPGNAHIDAGERRLRLDAYYRPYHGAVAAALERALEGGTVPALLSIHSFTAHWKGVARPWHAGVLWDRDPRLVRPLIEALEAGGDLIVGDNEPYNGALRNDTMYRHATSRGLPHALLEVRQDLIADDAGVAHWCDRLAPILAAIMRREDLRQIRHLGSNCD